MHVEQVEHSERVVRAIGNRVVAVDGGSGHELDVRMERSQHERDRVVGAGIDIEDQLGRRGHLRGC
jgi:hypothetical protein